MVINMRTTITAEGSHSGLIVHSAIQGAPHRKPFGKSVDIFWELSFLAQSVERKLLFRRSRVRSRCRRFLFLKAHSRESAL